MTNILTKITEGLSDKFKLNLKDVFNGLLMAVLGGVLTFIYQLIAPCIDLFLKGSTCSINVSYQMILLVGLGSGLSYLIKRFGSDSQGNFLGDGSKQA